MLDGDRRRSSSAAGGFTGYGVQAASLFKPRLDGGILTGFGAFPAGDPSIASLAARPELSGFRGMLGRLELNVGVPDCRLCSWCLGRTPRGFLFGLTRQFRF